MNMYDIIPYSLATAFLLAAILTDRWRARRP